MRRRDVVKGLAALGLAAVAPARAVGTAAWDVIVVGSGVAGLAAAVSAAQNGARRVLVLEKAPTIGGHSILSTGYVTAVSPACETEAQRKAEVEGLVADMLRLGEGRNDPALVRQFAEASGEAIRWMESLGLVWAPQRVQSVAGLSPRSFTSSLVRAGYDYVVTLNKAAASLGVEIRLKARATELLTREGRVVGVRVDTEGAVEELAARAVILATGGFTGNLKMRKKYAPRLDETFTTTADPYRDKIDYATGDGMLMAERIGAQLVDMDCVQTLPFWGGRLTDYVGADIYLNDEGDRFVNEAASWKQISDAIWALPEHACWVVTDSQSRKGASRSAKLIRGIVRQAASVREMAAGLNLPEAKLQATLDRYNAFVKAGRDDDLGKTMFTQTISVPPYYYGREHLYVHYCCGGVRFNGKSEVLRADGRPIPGLYAAGEVTGGLHGVDRLGGCSIADCLVFGRNAGRQAAKAMRERVAP